MGAELGAVVELSALPLKYQGLSYTEIWISEAQRMVLADTRSPCPHSRCSQPSKWRRPTWASSLRPADSSCAITGQVVADLAMEFLHQGQPG